MREWVWADFGVDLQSIDRVDLGADAAAELWRGVSDDGTYAVKLSGGGSPAGLAVPAHLAERGVSGVAGPVRTRQGLLWSERHGRRLSVVPWVSDQRALGGGMSRQHWTSFGALLARVHATAVTDALARELPREDHSHDAIAARVRAVDDRLRGEFTERDPADHLVRALQQEWRGGAGRVSTLLQQADRLGRELRNRETPELMCHGDPHLGNVLIGGEDKVWLVDWDDAVLAPRERDLMMVIGGVLAFAPVSAAEQAWFFEGYGEADVDSTRLAYYRCTRALVDVAHPAAQVLDRGLTEPERAEALAIVTGVLSPTGLVDLAISFLHDLGVIADENRDRNTGE